MALNSLNTNIAAYYAQGNMNRASTSAAASISRLSSGNRLVRAADDVASMSIGTTLQTNVTTLRRALLNASQASSLLQVADGGLAQITDILQRQKALSVQASGGTLSNAERSFLNQEFQNLTQEIDRIAKNTNFNGVQLLNGALAEAAQAQSDGSIGERGKVSVTFSQNIVAGSRLRVNWTNFTEGTDFTRGATLHETLDNLVHALNTTRGWNIAQSGYYSREGNSLVLTSMKAGSAAQSTINMDLAQSTMFSANGTASGARIAVVNGQHGGIITNRISGIAVTSITESAVTATSTAGQLMAGALQGSDNTATLATLANLVAGDSLETIVSKINANRNSTGVEAWVEGYAGNYSLLFKRNYNNVNETLARMSLGGAAMGPLTANSANGTKQTLAGVAQSGTDTGISAGDTTVSGTLGNNLLKKLPPSAQEIHFVFPEIADSDLLLSTNFGGPTAKLVIDTGVGIIEFGFVNQAPQTATEVRIGSTLAETLDNLVTTFNNYRGRGTFDYVFNQLEARRDGNTVVINGITGDPSYNAGVSLSYTGITMSDSPASRLNMRTTFDGLYISPITNIDFIGKIDGFTATYNGTSNRVDLQITVGDYTYYSYNMSTTGATSQQFISKDGGSYFQLNTTGDGSIEVNSQADADMFAARVNEAFSTLSFMQNRTLSSYQGNSSIVTDSVVTGSLIGTSMKLRSDDFSDLTIGKIQVNAPQGANKDGSISITINGEEYRTAGGLGSQLGQNGMFKLTSVTNADRVLEFRTGDGAIDFSSAAKATAFENALKQAFGMNKGSAALKFQIGTTPSDMLDVSIGNVDTRTIFKGINLDVMTQNNALAASDAIDAALKAVTSVRAEVGARQSRFDYASAGIQSAIQNQDSARGNLMDTDVAAEATAYAMAQVQLQAGISVLAQANKLPNYMLKLLEA